MRILQVVHGFPPNQMAGTEIYTYYLSKELTKNHKVYVLYPIFEKVRKTSVISFHQNNLILYELKLPDNKLIKFRNMLFFQDIHARKEIEILFEKIIKNLRPDVIHFEHVIGLSATFIEIAKKLNIPTVITLHDYWFMCPNIQLLRHNYTICEGPEPNKCFKCWIKKQSKTFSETLTKYYIPEELVKSLSEIIMKGLNYPKKFKERNKYLKNLLLRVDKIISPSRFLREIFVNYGIPKNKIIYSENGYNLKVFEGFKKKKDTDKIVFGFVGGISIHKGVHVVVDAFMNIPEDKAELRIYGNYSPNSEYVKRIFEKVEKKRNIKFVGRFENIKDPYSQIDILAFPSIWYENCPLVLMEAQATKTPVLASNLGAIPEFVEEGKTGLLFQPNNSSDLYEKIRFIVEHPELIEKFKANIKPPKSIKEQAKEIESVYKTLLEVDNGR